MPTFLSRSESKANSFIGSDCTSCSTHLCGQSSGGGFQHVRHPSSFPISSLCVFVGFYLKKSIRFVFAACSKVVRTVCSSLWCVSCAILLLFWQIVKECNRSPLPAWLSRCAQNSCPYWWVMLLFFVYDVLYRHFKNM